MINFTKSTVLPSGIETGAVVGFDAALRNLVRSALAQCDQRVTVFSIDDDAVGGMRSTILMLPEGLTPLQVSSLKIGAASNPANKIISIEVDGHLYYTQGLTPQKFSAAVTWLQSADATTALGHKLNVGGESLYFNDWIRIDTPTGTEVFEASDIRSISRDGSVLSVALKGGNGVAVTMPSAEEAVAVVSRIVAKLPKISY